MSVLLGFQWIHSLYVRAIQGHTGGTKVEPSVQGNLEIPCNWIEYIHIHSIQAGLIAGEEDSNEGRQTVFFTKRRILRERGTRGTVPNEVERFPACAVHWTNLKSVQDRGLVFWQTNSNATILNNSVPADCLEKVVQTRT